jgi:Cdc6-like AAA superfamily ATPase
MTDDFKQFGGDLAQIIRLASEQKDADLRLLLARLVRRYRTKQPDIATALSAALDASTAPIIRYAQTGDRREPTDVTAPAPSALSVLKIFEGVVAAPVLDARVAAQIETLLEEWREAPRLRQAGLEPLASAIFTGPPGVGKTHSARWIAAQLSLPMYSLDLTAVMSSRLGQSGANLRAALDFAKKQPSVLFLDEIDSIAKKRADESDVGELKRLVTIMLQELDDWPSTSLLLAATNHPELVDPALWRRFDLEVTFPMPTESEVTVAVERFLGTDLERFRPFVTALGKFFAGRSYSDIRRALLALRKGIALNSGSTEELVESLISSGLEGIGRAERIELAVDLLKDGGLSQHQVSRMTTVSRDTLRKRANQKTEN